MTYFRIHFRRSSIYCLIISYHVGKVLVPRHSLIYFRKESQKLNVQASGERTGVGLESKFLIRECMKEAARACIPPTLHPPKTLTLLCRPYSVGT